MREALNSNPVVQIAVVGVLIAVAGLFLMMNMKKKDETAAPPADAAATAGATAGTTAPTVTPDAGGTAVAPTTGTPSVTDGTVTPEALIPGPGLPADVVAAYKSGDAIVLLIVRPGAIDDKLVRESVEGLSEPGVSVFIADAKHVADYSRITQGVGVNRVPALVVVRPRRVSGAAPQAQVSYGFRNSQGVVQAVNDALYSGPDDLPYHPG